VSEEPEKVHARPHLTVCGVCDEGVCFRLDFAGWIISRLFVCLLWALRVALLPQEESHLPSGVGCLSVRVKEGVLL